MELSYLQSNPDSQYFQLQQTELSTTLANIVGDGVVPTFFAALGAILPFAAFQVRPLIQVYCWLFNRHILLICLKSKQMTSHQLGVSETLSFLKNILSFSKKFLDFFWKLFELDQMNWTFSVIPRFFRVDKLLSWQFFCAKSIEFGTFWRKILF